ncbi:hypothetical protein REH81_05045 [Vibrio rotiferianus]
MRKKNVTTFKNVPVGQFFYMKRYPDGSEADSIMLTMSLMNCIHRLCSVAGSWTLMGR